MITRINRIRLEFKVSGNSGRISRAQSINRIRLEFKAGSAGNSGDSRCSINRIRLEFKAEHEHLERSRKTVLIESDWNLKGTAGTLKYTKDFKY